MAFHTQEVASAAEHDKATVRSKFIDLLDLPDQTDSVQDLTEAAEILQLGDQGSRKTSCMALNAHPQLSPGTHRVLISADDVQQLETRMPMCAAKLWGSLSVLPVSSCSASLCWITTQARSQGRSSKPSYLGEAPNFLLHCYLAPGGCSQVLRSGAPMHVTSCCHHSCLSSHLRVHLHSSAGMLPDDLQARSASSPPQSAKQMYLGGAWCAE